MTVLVIAAHPDDEVLGCGGTIAKLSGEVPVHVAILGEGLTSRPGTTHADKVRGVEELREQARAAADVVGAESIRFEGLPDNRFDELPLLDVVQRVEQLIAEISPEVVYTHHLGDLNVDHQITARALLTATRPQGGQPVREVYSFEVASSTEWSFGQLQPAFRPNVFVDISTTVERKIMGLECYRDEIRPFPHPRSPEALRAAAGRWGSVCGVPYAEAFELVRSLR